MQACACRCMHMYLHIAYNIVCNTVYKFVYIKINMAYNTHNGANRGSNRELITNYVETHICEFISCAKEMKSCVLAKTPISVSAFLLCLYTYK